MSWGGDHGCDRLAIIGLGQIGASVGLAARAASAATRIVGCDLDPEAGRAALEMGAVTNLAETATDAAAGADLVVLAAPVLDTVKLVATIAPHLGPRCVLTDVGSAKEAVVAAMESVSGCSGRCAGGHPIAGGERRGPGAARADLFRGKTWVLCPGRATRADTLQTLRLFVSALGAVPLVMDAATHDREIARTSHVPYLAAIGICLQIGASEGREAGLRLAGSGLRDCTRIAASDPYMTASFCIANRVNVASALREAIGQMETIAAVLEQDDRGRLCELLARGQRVRIEAIGPFTEPGANDGR